MNSLINNRYLALYIVVVLVFFSLLACNNKENSKTKKTINGNKQLDSLVIQLAGITGKSVFDLTRENYDVEFVESSLGIFVNSIDLTPSTRNFGWFFSVNDSFVPVASNDYITNDTDVIKWHYRRF